MFELKQHNIITHNMANDHIIIITLYRITRCSRRRTVRIAVKRITYSVRIMIKPHRYHSTIIIIIMTSADNANAFRGLVGAAINVTLGGWPTKRPSA